MDETRQSVVVGLNAVVIVVIGDTPKVLAVHRPHAPLTSSVAEVHRLASAGEADYVGLPFGPFDPSLHRTLEIGLRSWVEEQTSLRVDYVEQLYTFGDRGRFLGVHGMPRVVSVCYLALTREAASHAHSEGAWESWYRYFPWEDLRGGEPPIIQSVVRPGLDAWAEEAPSDIIRARRKDRINLCFGQGGLEWDEEKTLERYELLYEAGLVAEARRDRLERQRAHAEIYGSDSPQPADRSADLSRGARSSVRPDDAESGTGQGAGEAGDQSAALGEPMQFDHRRILATGISRLRGKLKYRPVVFELMAPTFTLWELQRTVEAIAGICVHKQNFRRLVERSGLVEGTGQFLQTGGRPAEAFRFRRAVLRERSATGIGLPRFKP